MSFGATSFCGRGYPFILTNVCEGYDVDVFCHFWFDEKLQTEPYKFGECGKGDWHHQRIASNAVEKVLEIYQPVAYKIDHSKSFTDSAVPFEPSLKRYWYGALEDSDQDGFRWRTINNCLSYFYSLNEVNKLKKEYEYAKDFKYDWVVRCRTDTVLQSKIPFEQLDPSVINFSNLQNQPDGMINDWFDFAGSKEMDVFMSVFPVWQLILEKCMKETGVGVTN